MGGLTLRACALRRAQSSLCGGSAALATFRQEAISRVGQWTSHVPSLALHLVIFQLDGHCPCAFPRADGGFLGWSAVAGDGFLPVDGRLSGVIEAVRGWAVLDVAQHDVHAGVAQRVRECEVVRDVIGADDAPHVFLASDAAMDHDALLPFHGAREFRQLLDGAPHDELALQPWALPFPYERALRAYAPHDALLLASLPAPLAHAHDAHAANDAHVAHDARGVEVPDAQHFRDFRHGLVPTDALLGVQVLSPEVVALQRVPSGAGLPAILADFLQR